MAPKILKNTSLQCLRYGLSIFYLIFYKAADCKPNDRSIFVFNRTEHMKARISVLTIGVDNLERSFEFYHHGLGLPSAGITGQEFAYGAVAFFDLQNGVKLAIWPRKNLAHDTGIPVGPSSATEFTIGHNVASREEVDAVMALAAQAG